MIWKPCEFFDLMLKTAEYAFCNTNQASEVFWNQSALKSVEYSPIWNKYSAFKYFKRHPIRTNCTSCWVLLIYIQVMFLAPASEGWGKVIFLICVSVHRGEEHLPWTGGGGIYLGWGGCLPWMARYLPWMGRVPTLDGGGGTYLWQVMLWAVRLLQLPLPARVLSGVFKFQLEYLQLSFWRKLNITFW